MKAKLTLPQERRRRNRQQAESTKFEADCRDLLTQGHSISRISKQLGKSYQHTKMICLRIQQEETP